ncbi:histone-like nucleoid-structuring protein, MvaT/MvaU family [Pseudomonas sp. MF4836]|uniref:histone-like nucleoid-structuring protein, MvaT/MvaU family n=1 Tax=Pseudomonas sp. MF4836 TaxID=1960827 RepID=UPI0009981BF0|nr:histone-like nucleoid-structuring protein, MvaT/MvaU family [Pseudomonas sp. MF4836]OOV93590.1 transcriptional regulator [Pseudomonas sp. MF4836]
MSKLAEFRQLEKHLAEQLAALEVLKGDEGLAQEIEFEQKLRNLLGEYGKSLREVILILDPAASSRKGSAPAPIKATRRERLVKVYKNPHTGETIETKGGNHKQLKEWKSEFGAETVESWLSK